MKTLFGKRKFVTLLLLAIGLHAAADIELYCTAENGCYQLNTTTHKATLSGGNPSTNLVILATINKDAVDYTVTAVKKDAFKDNEAISSVSIPATIDTIGKNAFAASSITSSIIRVTFADICSTSLLVDSEAFYNCKMDTVILPVNTKQINWRAFNQCHDMKRLVIPNTVDSIESLAFRYCDGLTQVCVSWPASEVDGLKIKSDIFDGVPTASIPLYVPIGTGDTYKAKEPWKYFKIMSDTIVILSAPNPNNRTYDGTWQDLVFAGSVTGGSMYYSIDNSHWSDTIPKGKDVGIYTVYYKVISEVSHEDYIPASNAVTVTIQPDVFEIHAHADPNNPTEYYSTFYHSSKDYQMPDGVNVEAYVATLSDGALYLNKVAEGTDILPHGQAVILKANTNTFVLSRSFDDPITISATNNLQGTDISMPAPEHCYVLSDHAADHSETGLGFYQYAIALTPHKAFVLIPDGASQAPKRLRFIFDTPTGIESISNNPLNITNKVIVDGQLIIIREGVQYNAYGQKIQ